MKKLLTIIALFVSSFFFIFIEDAKAAEYEFNVDLSLINEDFYTFKSTMEEFIKNDTTYSDKFIIVVGNGTYQAIIFPLEHSYSVRCTIYSNTWFNLQWGASGSFPRVKGTNNYTSYEISGNFANYDNYVYISFFPVYANFDILMISDGYSSTVTYKYEDFTTINTADGEDKFKTLYMINEEYQSFIGNSDLVHKEELEKVESFYTTVIEKLSYLGEVIVSNYIYLSIIVIFILIFVFLLIFRRHL